MRDLQNCADSEIQSATTEVGADQIISAYKLRNN